MVAQSLIEKGPDAIRAQFKKKLADLGTDYLDLYLVHWPVPGKHVQAYQTLEDLCSEGKVRGKDFRTTRWRITWN